MAVLHSYYCRVCGAVSPDCWSDDVPVCCGSEKSIAFVQINTPEWGGPRQYVHLRDEFFESRSALDRYARKEGLELGPSAEKVGGARNEDHMHLGKLFSYKKTAPRKAGGRA